MRSAASRCPPGCASRTGSSRRSSRPRPRPRRATTRTSRFERGRRRWAASARREARRVSLEIYERARAHAEARGILLADTKFEFGVRDGRLIWIDEALTPDSSRFWPSDGYEPGRGQPSFDKQFVRDYLETLAWDKRPPGPALPREVVARTREKYGEASSASGDEAR